MKRQRKLAAAAFGVMLLAGGARAEDVWISANNVVVRTEMSPAAEKVADVPKGAKVQQLEVQGNWVKIQMNGKIGWVGKASISPRPQKADSGSTGGSDVAMSSSAAAVKGLTPLAIQFAQNQHLSDAGVKQMEQTNKVVTPSMLTEFMAQGHVGTGQ